jgi:hypothetical protein
MTALFNISRVWTGYWSILKVDPNSRPHGFALGHHEWVLLNQFRTTQGRSADSPVCDCEADQQTMSYIVNKCPIRRFNGGLVELSEAGPNAISF